MGTESIHLLIVKEDKNISFETLNKEKYSIGRSTADDILLTNKGVSRCHATVHFSNGCFWLVDGDLKGRVSTNGIFVNGQRVSVHKLNQHDIITFCKGVYAFYLEHQGELEAVALLEQSLRKTVDFIIGSANVCLEPPTASEIHNLTFVPIIKNPFLDDLTKLPNRSAFFGRVEKSIEIRQKISVDHKFSVLFIDVDRFKMINDSLGHLVGDKFLIRIAEILSSCLREGDMVARLGGDEFAILLDDLHAFEEALSVAKRIQQALVEPLNIESHELYPSISIGIALSSLDYQTVEEIIRDADTAMYHAKSTGRGKFVVFDEKMHKKAIELLQLDGDLRKAIENHELQLDYQPIVSIKERTLAGFEALIRWNHPSLGLISPDIFIPIAEETNLIYQIGHWVLDEACYQLNIWGNNPAITTALSMNINISSKQFADPNLVERLKVIIDKYGINPNNLKLEVTESIVMENGPRSVTAFKQLKQLGVQLAIDDFGTGYSSLSYLNRFPIDTLKVDRTFISEMDSLNQNTCGSIASSIIGLAHSLGVKVVAEGVEKLYHLAWLEQQRCDYAQGFLFSKSLNSKDATSLAERGIDWQWKI